MSDKTHQEKMGLKYLGWFDGWVCDILWTRTEPTFDANEKLVPEGVKLRCNAVLSMPCPQSKASISVI